MPRANNPPKGELLDAWGRRANRKYADKKCAHCGAIFQPRKATSKYCSRPCARKKNGGHNRKDESWWLNSNGYIEGRVWVNGQQRRVKQHRWVMERHLGRRLMTDENVHHINGVKTDNRLSNLQVMSHSEHSAMHYVPPSSREVRQGEES